MYHVFDKLNIVYELELELSLNLNELLFVIFFYVNIRNVILLNLFSERNSAFFLH